MNDSVLGLAMKNVRYYENIKVVTHYKRRNFSESEPNTIQQNGFLKSQYLLKCEKHKLE